MHVTSRADRCGFVLNPVTHCGADVVFVSVVECACLCCGMRVSWLVECPEGLESVPSVLKSVSENHAVTLTRTVGHKARPPLCNLSRLLRRVAPPAAAAAHTVSCAAGRQMAVAAAPSTKRAIVAPRAATKVPPPPCEWAVRFSECLSLSAQCARAVLGFQARSLGGVIACRPVRIPVASAVFFLSMGRRRRWM